MEHDGYGDYFIKYQNIQLIEEDSNNNKKRLKNFRSISKTDYSNNEKEEIFSMDFFIIAIIFLVFICALFGLVR